MEAVCSQPHFRWVFLCDLKTARTIGISGVVFYPLLALGVTLGDMAHEDTETIERVALPLAKAYEMLEAGEIQDGPSSLTLWHARRPLAERGLL